MAPQAFDSADKLELPTSRKQLSPWEAMRGGSYRGCLVGRAEWWDDIEFDRQKYEGVDLLHPLSSLLTGMVFAFRLVFSLVWNVARGWQRSAIDLKPPSVPHCEQVFASHPYTL